MNSYIKTLQRHANLIGRARPPGKIEGGTPGKSIRILSWLLLVLMIPASLAAKDKQVAQTLKDAEALANVVFTDTTIPLEQYSYLIPKDEIEIAGTEGSALGSKQLMLIQPGEHSYVVRYWTLVRMQGNNTSVSAGGMSVGIGMSPSMKFYSEPANVSAVFEPGKFYTIDYKKHMKSLGLAIGLEASIVEVNAGKAFEDVKAIREKMSAYRASFRANAGALDGTYTGKGSNRITIDGNKFFISVSYLNIPMLFKGTIGYNNDTIILRSESSKMAKNRSMPSSGMGYMYYKLHDGILDIVDQSGNLGATVKGQFSKSSLTSADRARVLANLDFNTVPDAPKGDMFALDYPEEYWGSETGRVDVQGARTSEQVRQAIMETLQYYNWVVKNSKDGLFIGSYSSKQYPVYVKYDSRHVDIYVHAGNDSIGWSENLRRMLDNKLNSADEIAARATAAALAGVSASSGKSGTGIFALDYPDANWGQKSCTVDAQGAHTTEQVRQAIVETLRAYHWVLQSYKDGLIIGSYGSGEKYPVYVKYDSQHVDIYVNAGVKSKGWAEALRKTLDKKLNSTKQ